MSTQRDPNAPTPVEPEKTAGGPLGRFSSLYVEAERLVAAGEHLTMMDAYEALGLDLQHVVALHAWEAGGGS